MKAEAAARVAASSCSTPDKGNSLEVEVHHTLGSW